MLLLPSVDVVPHGVYSLGLVVPSMRTILCLQIYRLAASQDGYHTDRSRCPDRGAYRCDQTDRLAR